MLSRFTVFLLVVLLPFSAKASIMTFEFGGALLPMEPELSNSYLPATSFPAGSRYSGELVIDTGQTGFDWFGRTTQRAYRVQSFSLFFPTGDQIDFDPRPPATGSDPTGRFFVNHDPGRLSGFFFRTLASASEQVESIELRMSDTDGTAFAGTGLDELVALGQSGDLSDFELSGFKLTFGEDPDRLASCSPSRTCLADFSIDEFGLRQDPPAVPLPAAGWLLLAAIASIAGLRRRA